MTRVWTGISTNLGSNSGTINIFFSVLGLSDRFRTHTVPCLTVPGSLALGEEKCPSCEHKYSPTTTAKFKNEWSYTFTPHSLHGEVMNEHKNKLTLYLYINPLKPSGHYTYRTVVTVRTAHWSLYVPHSGHYTYRIAITIRTAHWSQYVPHSGHYMYRTVVTICTAQWSLYVPHSGHYLYHQFNIHTFLRSAHTVYLCVLCGSENK